MTLMQLEVLLADHFSAPFLPDGHVQANVTDKGTLRLKIGRRLIEFNDAGQLLSSETEIAK